MSEDRLPPDPELPETAQQRAALVVYLLMLGRRLRVSDVAHLTGLTYGGAWVLMQNVAGVVPVYDHCGVYQIEAENRKGFECLGV